MNPNHDDHGRFADGSGGGGDHAHTHVVHANDLKAAATDNQRFDAKIAQISADKSIGKDAMRAIATNFLGHGIKSSVGRAGAVQEIKTRQTLNQRSDARAAQIGRMKAW